MTTPARRRIPRERLVLGAVVFVLMYVAYFRAFRGHVIGSWRDPDDWRPAAALAALTTVFSYLTLLPFGLATRYTPSI